MSTTQPARPDTAGPSKRRNPWIWIAAVLAVACIGVLVWALALRSDLDSTNQDVAELQAQVEQQSVVGGTALSGLKAAFDGLAADLGATQDDLAAAKQNIGAAKQELSDAQQEAAAAAQQATDAAGDAVAQGQARADEAQANAQAATAKTRIAADCAKAYLSALGALFDGDSIRAQASAVREQLSSISADCRTALAGA